MYFKKGSPDGCNLVTSGLDSTVRLFMPLETDAKNLSDIQELIDDNQKINATVLFLFFILFFCIFECLCV